MVVRSKDVDAIIWIDIADNVTCYLLVDTFPEENFCMLQV
jgi:hypothetical protein